MLRRALATVGGSLVDLWENIFVLVTANLIWSLSLLPGVLLGATLQGGLLSFILAFVLMAALAGPTTIALFYMTAETSRRERVELGDFWYGIKHYYRRGWVLGGLNAFFVLMAIFNLIFYSQPSFNNSPVGLMYVVWVYVILTWMFFQLYLWTLAIRMEPDGRLPFRLLLRNTGLALFKYLGFSLLVGILTFIILILELVVVLIPMVLFGLALYGLISNRATKMVLLREAEQAATPKEGQMKATIDAPVNVTKTNNLSETTTSDELLSKTGRNLPPGVVRRGSNPGQENK